MGLTTSQNLLYVAAASLFQRSLTYQSYACIRAFFKGSYLKDGLLCAAFVEKECVNIWIGHDMHLVQSTLRDGDEFNWILTHKDTTDITESWYQPGDMNEVRRIIATCDPHIAAAVNKTEKCLDWKICYHDPIPTWVSKNHTIALLGDSCHPHLPTRAQGASQATESAAVLAECFEARGPRQCASCSKRTTICSFSRTVVASVICRPYADWRPFALLRPQSMKDCAFLVCVNNRLIERTSGTDGTAHSLMSMMAWKSTQRQSRSE